VAGGCNFGLPYLLSPQCIEGVIRVRDKFYRTPFVSVCVIASVHAAPRACMVLAHVTVDKIRGGVNLSPLH
jgi:hypothetical protein